MEETTDEQMTHAEFKQWVEAMQHETWEMVKSCHEKKIEHSDIWAHQWIVFKRVNEVLKNVSCE